jgi:hypothetical protein
VIEARNTFVEQGGEIVGVKRTTLLSDDFLASLESERLAKAHMRAAEIDRVASVPTHVADIWLKQGFDLYRAKPKDIVARLRKEGLEAFITTSKAL